MPQYYLDSPNFATATAVYANATLTVLAPDGYYSSNGIVRSQVGGQLTAYAECESCKRYQKPVEGELLLDLYPDAVAAFSLNQLSTSYTGAAVRVRRASDSVEQDIGFTSEFVLDVAALEAFCTGTDGFVAVWYDQSGNERNASNPNTASQFKIYDASTGYLGELQERASNVLAYLKYDAVVIPQPYTVFGVANLGPAIYPQLFDSTTTPSVHIVYAPSNVQMTAGIILSGGALTEETHLLTGLYNGVNSELFVDGDSRVSGNAGDSSISFGVVGNRYTISNSANNVQSIKELIIYPTDQSANRAGIESDINSRYNIYWDGTVTSLLDAYPDAAAAYSLRALSSSYTGPIVRVRRASDNAETDVYALYNGELNTSAIESFCTGTDGFVTVWYDQSSGENDATQTTTANQPKIYDISLGVVTEGGKPAVYFLDTFDIMTSAAATEFNGVIQNELYVVASYDTINIGNQYAAGVRIGGSSRGVMVGTHTFNGNIRYYSDAASFEVAIGGTITANTQILHGGTYDGTTRHARLNGASVGTNTDPGGTGTADEYFIGKNPLLAAGEAKKVQEVIIYAGYNGNELGIESNINQAYNIYWDGTVTALLDDYQGAAAAYSLRALNSFYTGPLVRVRRESDNAEQDIRALYNGELDTSSLSSFSAGTNAYVAVWYDQSSGGNDLTQATTTAQPKIYDASAGVVLDANGDATLDGSATTLTFMNFASSIVLNTNWAFIVVGDFANADRTAGGGSYQYIYWTGANTLARSDISGGITTTWALNSIGSKIVAGYMDSSSGNFTLRVNGSENDQTANTANYTLSSAFYYGNTSLWTKGSIKEIIIYDSSKYADRAGIETNINDFYTIY